MASSPRLLPLPNPATVAPGVTDLLGFEPVGFSIDDGILLVKGVFIPAGGSALCAEIWPYDLETETYGTGLLTNILGTTGWASSFKAVDVSTGQSTAGKELFFLLYEETTSSGSNNTVVRSRIGLIEDGSVKSTDLLADYLGGGLEMYIANIASSTDGRFLAFQTSSGLVLDDGLDSNDLDDVYLLDRETASIYRVSEANGYVQGTESILDDVRSFEGLVQVSFTSAGQFTTDSDSNDLPDVFTWILNLQERTANTKMISALDRDAQAGEGLLLSESIMVYERQQEDGSIDVFVVDSSASAKRLASFFTGTVSEQQLFGLSDSSDVLLVQAITTDTPSSEVPQLWSLEFRSDTVKAKHLSINTDGAAANDAVGASVLSDSGKYAAFTTQATNLPEAERTESITKLYLAKASGLQASGQVYHWKTHALMSDVEVKIGEADGKTVQGQYALGDLSADALSISFDLTLGSSEKRAVNAADALAALKIAIGRNPNTDGAPLSPYQLLAADIDGSGRVTAADALNILKLAIGRADAPKSDWVFVDERYPFWDATTGKYTVTERAITWKESIISESEDDIELNMVGVLRGDVNGSWTPPTEAERLDQTYFQKLVDESVAPFHQWAIIA